MKDIHTLDFHNLCHELEKKGVHPKRVGAEAMKKLGIERSIKKRYHDDYLDEKARKP
jgi:hypothetical protein